ncbi:FAD-dependent oxidoreductase [Lactococcus laudensis]|uniref:FAD-dependent oxidoreductase n=1 Tax=Pseudolactococcus laudensis TaxID=1494461 RepID=A0A7V8N2H2_9LACT|nr:FAD-dependent oxidoreductase [Lactococcus laudensis]MBA0017441.1 FAD-dependent oxidoreductase [Lactococcus laudensis]MBW9282238.1 pyridine nucleotide-disulfide oxidoreductase [Lactococcus laudensis]
MAKKIVIIGGVAGGATAATRLRRLSEEDEIVLFEKGPYISFANCGLPYHVGKVIKEREDLLLQTPEGMSAQYNLDIRVLSEVLEVHPEDHKVIVKNQETGETYEENFDKLIISTGAKAIIPQIPGLSNAKNVFTLRNIPDMDKIKAHISKFNIKTATVIGGGFIGLEMMENLVELGLNVQLVEMSPQVMPNIDIELAQMLHSQINMHGVKLLLNNGLKSFHDNGMKIELNDGQILDTDMTILSIGVVPENSLAKDANIELGFKGAIKVDRQMRTNHADIYAIGDVIEVEDAVSGLPTNIPLAWPANRQGRLVADVINGMEAEYTGTQGTSVAKVFELTVAGTGNSERLLKSQGIEYEVIHIHPNSHAGYYPGASPIALKLLFGRKDGKIFGAQAVGVEGVEKRIDVIATAMKFGAKAPDLAKIELSYAPPYSSAKDPVNMLGYTADNMMHEKVSTFQWSEISDLKAAGAYFLDVREDFELATGLIEGGIQIPLNQLRDRLNELPKDQTIYVYCQVGARGYNAARILMQKGFEVKNLDGGYKTYKNSKYQLRNITFKSENLDKPKTSQTFNGEDIELDACGLQCPGPILKVKENIDKMELGQRLNIKASDFGFAADIENWAKATGNTVIKNEIEGNKIVATVLKGKENPDEVLKALSKISEGTMTTTPKGATIVLFSGDLDKALASMIIATGAASFGKEVTIFCTFWGLNLLKKNVKIKKKGIAKLFDIMLPSQANQMPISKMNMAGMGSAMIKEVMKQKNVDALPIMIEKAHQLGVKFVACTMSMDIMGIDKVELFDWVEYGGVATFIGDSEEANMQLFI